MSQSIGPTLRKNWQRFSGKPFGKWLFSYFVGRMAPYSGTIGAIVQQLEPGHGLVTLREHRRVQNHLKSVHAIALVNLAELSTGLTLMNSLPDKTRGILTAIEMKYHKKSRGLLSAECFCDIPAGNDEKEIQVITDIKDSAGDIVATGVASWLIGPEKS